MINYVNPKDGQPLVNRNGAFLNTKGEIVARIINDVPRFVEYKNDYDRSFGWQWNHWANNRSSARGSALDLEKEILRRTRFDKYDMDGKTILECGMGGGDDTEVLRRFSFSEIHSFDVSHAVDRAKKFIEDDRIVFTQASIFEIPYPDYSFDVVYCHRVLQHTPDPKKALESICRKVKLNGVLFAHAYKRSRAYMAEWRYKYRFITKRLPISWILAYVNVFGAPLHYLNKYLYSKNKFLRAFAYRFIPFYKKDDAGQMSEREVIELEKLITFDALTPRYDDPMTSEDFFGIIEKNGFEIEFKHDPRSSPMYCTAVRKRIV